MALVNPNIAMSVKPLEVQFRNPMAEAAQVMNVQQAQMQMEKLRQTDEAIERIRQAAVKNGGPGDLNEIAQAFLLSPDLGHQQLGLKIREQQREKQEFETMGRKLYPQLFGAEPAAAAPAAPPAAAPMAPAQPGALGSGTFDITPAPVTNALAPAPVAPTNQLTPAAPAAAPAVNALAAPNTAQQLSPSGKTRQELEGLIFMAQRNPLFKGMAETAKLELAEMMKAPVYHNVPGVGLVDPRTKQVIMPSVESTPTEIKQYELAKQQGFTGTFFDYKRKLAEATRTPAQPSAPVAVVDETGKTRYVSREEAIGKGMTPANAFEGITPKEIQKREAALPQAKASVAGFESKTDQFIKDLESLRDDPGLNDITGPVYGRTPSVSRAGSRAQANYNKIFAKGGFQGLQDLREASKTGGALGNVSNEEGRRLEASVVGGLDRTQHIDDVKAGINALIEDLKVSKARVRNTFDETYQYKSGRTSAGPAAPAPDPLGIR